jgi:hypothetical protein
MVFRVFLDETGTHGDDAPVTAIAAYFAEPKYWDTFERHWLATLAAFGLKQFHMSKYAHSVGAFEGWTRQKSVALATELFPLIPEYTRWGVAVAMVKTDFDEGLKEYPTARKALGEAYECCFHWLVALVLDRAQELDKTMRMEFIHEDNDYKGAARKIWDEICKRDNAKQLVSLSFATKNEFIPLQAADVFAYEAQKSLADPDRPERKSLTALRASGTITIQHIERQWLKDNGERLEKLARTGAAPLV